MNPKKEKIEVSDIDSPTGVVSSSEATGLFAAMPAEQAGADALTEEIMNTHKQKTPVIGDGEIRAKK